LKNEVLDKVQMIVLEIQSIFSPAVTICHNTSNDVSVVVAAYTAMRGITNI